MDVEGILAEMTAEEKAAIVSGTNFMYTNPVPRLGIPSLRMADGPHGLRAQEEGGDNGVKGSLPATAFPTAACIASGWNPENLRKMGRAIARECRKYGVHILLGPGANIKRNPLAGRNFEYFSEDPLLAGTLAAAEVRGVQEEGVGACVKHFALNNSENFRFMGNSIADARAMREIYLKVFEIIVREGRPAAMMSAYNKVNGEYCSQNGLLLSDILRGEWGFDGLTMTDWGGMHDRAASLRAGLDLEMPGDTAICRRQILDGTADGSLKGEVLDRAAGNVLRAVGRYASSPAGDADFAAHDALACEIAEDCAVLLKNDGILPLSEEKEVLAVGALFEKMRYQGAGSSMINAVKITSPKTALDEMGIRYAYARGYAENSSEPDAGLIAEAVKCAEKYDTLLVFLGLTDYAESESCDREHMRLPENQLALMDALAETGKRIAVVLFGGAPVELPFAERVNAVLNMYLPGQSGGRACANLLFGRAEPAGRLAETWPVSYSDVPFGERFGKGVNEIYKESVYVGYRYYTAAGVPVHYPFGFGLSYTVFTLRDMKVRDAGDRFEVSCEVFNAGERGGAEVVQLYVQAPRGSVFGPVRELRAFQKVWLKAGERRTVSLAVRKEDLRYFDIRKGDWAAESGEYELQLCSDCNTVLLSEKVYMEGDCAASGGGEAEAAYAMTGRAEIGDALFEQMSGLKIPPLPPRKPLTLESRFSDFTCTFWGRILFRAVLGMARRQLRAAKRLPEGEERENGIKGALFLGRVLESNSLHSMSMCAGQRMPYNIAEGLVHLANGKLLRALKCFCSRIKVPPLPRQEKATPPEK